MNKDLTQMSDEEFLNAIQEPSTLANAMDPGTSEDQDDSAKVDDESTEEDETSEEKGEETDTEEGTDTQAEDTSEEDEEVKDTDKEEEDTSDTSADKGKEKKVEKPAKSEDTAVDYEAQMKKLLAPFKANGSTMQVESVDEAIKLMQMGANYQKKMSSLKPGLKTLKLLENHKVTDEDIGYLLDLKAKNPEAIKRLIKESGIDPLDIDLKANVDYKPTVRTVDESEMAFEEIDSELRSNSDTYAKTWQNVLNMDAESKRIISKHPQLLRTLDENMASGVHDIIISRVTRERMFGKLEGLSDLEAYKQVGDALEKQGAFDHIGKERNNADIPTAKPKVVAVTKPNSKQAAKERAALPKSGNKTGNSIKTVDDLFALSDEEFLKTV